MKGGDNMSKQQAQPSINLLMLLQVIFIAFKVAGVIDWSWVMVFIPLWINIGVVIVVLLLALIVSALEK